MTDDTRKANLKAALNERRDALNADVRGRVREGRGERWLEGGDAADQSDAHIREDMQLALLQMRVETLARIDEAIGRLDAGEYGSCIECGRTITERRLRALPFAVRCRACADSHEHEQHRAHRLANPHGGSVLYPDSSRR